MRDYVGPLPPLKTAKANPTIAEATVLPKAKDNSAAAGSGSALDLIKQANEKAKTATSTTAAKAAPAEARPLTATERQKQEAILENIIKLIQTASIKPGGDNFKIATENLNQFFEAGVSPAEYLLSQNTRDFLAKDLPPTEVEKFESTRFEFRDARHLEDCMLYHGIASRVAGDGDDLTRVTRVFDWMCRQVQLVPAESLAPMGTNLRQAQARPYDVLLRGMATESEGFWSERGWLFMVLCRQLGVDVGLVGFSRPVSSLGFGAPGQRRPEPQGVVWISTALINDKPYLFDTKLGIPIPGPGGKGVATLDDAMADPEILAGLELPGESSYPVTQGDLVNSPTKITIYIDSSRGYHSPRMRLLQRQLAGKYRTILFRDAAEEAAHFARALGPKLGRVQLWGLPINVEDALFTSPDFVTATQYALAPFRSELPLLYARMAQLRGEIPDAIMDYVGFRFAENATFRDPKKTPIPPEVQRLMDIYATYFLAQCHLDQGNAKQAEFFFNETLRLVPEPNERRPYMYMLRYGAASNLGRLAEAKGDAARATLFYAQRDPTSQRHGNLIRARNLVWNDPMASIADPLPPAPANVITPGSRPAAPTAPGGPSPGLLNQSVPSTFPSVPGRPR